MCLCKGTEVKQGGRRRRRRRKGGEKEIKVAKLTLQFVVASNTLISDHQVG